MSKDITSDPKLRVQMVQDLVGVMTAEINGDPKLAEEMFMEIITERLNQSQGNILDLIQLLATQLEASLSIVRVLSKSMAEAAGIPEAELWQDVAAGISDAAMIISRVVDKLDDPDVESKDD